MKYRMLVLLPLLAAANGKTTEAQGNETVCLEMPAGWCLAHSGKDGPMELAEYVRKGETVRDWTEMITVLQMDGMPDANLDRFRQILEGESAARCTAGHRFELKEQTRVGGVPAQILSVACRELARSPEISLQVEGSSETQVHLLLAGRRNLYSVQRARRGSDPGEVARREWIRFLKTARPCQNRTAVPACR